MRLKSKNCVSEDFSANSIRRTWFQKTSHALQNEELAFRRNLTLSNVFLKNFWPRRSSPKRRIRIFWRFGSSVTSCMAGWMYISGTCAKSHSAGTQPHVYGAKGSGSMACSSSTKKALASSAPHFLERTTAPKPHDLDMSPIYADNRITGNKSSATFLHHSLQLVATFGPATGSAKTCVPARATAVRKLALER